MDMLVWVAQHFLAESEHFIWWIPSGKLGSLQMPCCLLIFMWSSSRNTENSDKYVQRPSCVTDTCWDSCAVCSLPCGAPAILPGKVVSLGHLTVWLRPSQPPFRIFLVRRAAPRWRMRAFPCRYRWIKWEELECALLKCVDNVDVLLMDGISSICAHFQLTWLSVLHTCGFPWGVRVINSHVISD